MPLVLHKITVEPTKPRKCADGRPLNEATRSRDGRLEGLGDIRAACQAGGVGFGCPIDEKAGYYHHRLSPRSQDLFGFILFDYVFVYQTLPFGKLLTCYFCFRFGLTAVCVQIWCDARLTPLNGAYIY
jgi:hypothetical protein